MTNEFLEIMEPKSIILMRGEKMAVGEKIRNLRKHKNTQAQLAEAIGVHEMTLRRWEAGSRVPNADDLKKLAAALNTSVAYLMDETDNPEPLKAKILSLSENIGFLDSAEVNSESKAPQPDPRAPVFEELSADPRKFAAAALLADMDDDQLRKSYDFLSDQKQLAELKKRQGA
jgi:transcriptional regulator with XRE-family HTH domain